jgi:DNA-binding SARP family transcriptional activator
VLKICVLGETEVDGESHTVTLRGFGGVKTRQILELLVLHRGHALPKDRLAEFLWEGRPPTDHIATLESYVCVLRRKLEPYRVRSSSVIVTGNGSYALDMARVQIDLDEFDRLMHEALEAEPEAALRKLLTALALVRGPLLAHEPYLTWAAAARQQSNVRILDATMEAARLSLLLNDVHGCARLADEALRLDPLSETACQLVMRALWAAGRRADALRRYETFRKALRREIGVDPSQQTQDLFVTILKSDTPSVSTVGSQELTALLDAVADLYLRARAARTPMLSGSGSPSLALSGGQSTPQALTPETAEGLIVQLVDYAQRHGPALAVAG